MTRLIVTFKPCDVLVVPFPFVDSPRSKPRPVVVLSGAEFNQENGHCVAAMVTTAVRSRWTGDVAIQDLAAAGLSHASVVRLKIFTLDARVGARKIGALSAKDRTKLQAAFRKHFPLAGAGG
jgi:mRNA interferase MazF